MDINTFAEQIKQKYPQYKGVDNQTLANSVLEKYPAYRQKITVPSSRESIISDLRRGTPLKPTTLPEGEGRVGDDIKETGLGIQEAGQRAISNVRESIARGAEMEDGEFKQKRTSTVLQAIGSAAKGAADILGETAIGAVKVVLPPKIEEKVKRGVIDVVTGVIEDGFGQQVASDWQQFSEAHPEAAENIKGGLGILEAGLEVIGGGAAVKTAADVAQTAKRTGKEAVEDVISRADDILPKRSVTPAIKSDGGIIKTIEDTAVDVLSEFGPQQLSERNFARAFKLAPSDVADLDNIVQGPISEWAIANNLIKGTTQETVESMIKFKFDNYNSVRDAVAAVDDVFSFKNVPEAENIIDALIKRTEGLKSAEYSSINNDLKAIAQRLNNGEASLLDIQFLKSSLDDIESIFKRSSGGGVKEGVRFQDLASSRSEVQRFIEDTVAQKFPEVNIKELNRNVRAARGLVDDIAKRAGKFDTQSSASLGDYFVFGLGQQVAPGAGPAVFAVKKVAESAPIRLRLTQALSRAKKRPTETNLKEIRKILQEELGSQLNINQSFNTGAVPKTAKQALKDGNTTIIDPDRLKKLFNDFDPKNHDKYSDMAEKIYKQELQSNPNPVVKFTAGGSGSGKSEAVVSVIKNNFDGIIVDGTLKKYDSAIRKIEEAAKNGKKSEIYAVINDWRNAWKFVQKRGDATGRYVPAEVFAEAHAGVPQTLRKLIKDGYDVSIKDTTKISTKEAAKAAPFMSNPQEMLDFIDSLSYNKDDILREITK